MGKQKVGHYYAQELNGSTYNLLRMNLLMHGVPYKEFTTYNDDTLRVDNFDKKKTEQFTVQVSNPPYSLKWAAPKAMEDDPRYSAAGVLAPKSYADLAFLEHMVYHMADDGRIAVLLPHGVLFRGGAEKKIHWLTLQPISRHRNPCLHSGTEEKTQRQLRQHPICQCKLMLYSRED